MLCKSFDKVPFVESSDLNAFIKGQFECIFAKEKGKCGKSIVLPIPKKKEVISPHGFVKQAII